MGFDIFEQKYVKPEYEFDLFSCIQKIIYRIFLDIFWVKHIYETYEKNTFQTVEHSYPKD